ncbi:MAG: hypothetical protein ACKV2V_07580 [Blastocatellia bacterium]
MVHGAGLTLSFHQPAGQPGKQNRERWSLKLDFIGANPAARLVGREQTAARMSYFNGAPSSWQTGVRSYRAVVYQITSAAAGWTKPMALRWTRAATRM